MINLEKYGSQEEVALYHCQDSNKQIYHESLFVLLQIMFMNTFKKICLHQELEHRKNLLTAQHKELILEKICLRLTIKKPERCQSTLLEFFWCFIVKGTKSFEFDNLVVSPLTCQFNVSKFAHCKTKTFVVFDSEFLLTNRKGSRKC